MKQFALDRIRSWLRFILHLDGSPRRAALAFALGVFIAWTPALGLHTLLALVIAFFLGLTRVAILAGTLVNNPWTIVPIYSGSAYLGAFLLRSQLPPPRFEGISTLSDLGEFLGQFRPWLGPLLTGTFVLGLASALVSFTAIFYGLRWYGVLRRSG